MAQASEVNAPTLQTPEQRDIDLTPACRRNQHVPPFALGCAATNQNVIRA
jgi:hypothetical protein